ncbi:hypothetical protein HU200_038366 [Digitaria exilis]|uniref:RNase H type-1 domain-containing protein n=1 Tax=Digitaria exilis TaxID=1010633 RepID=A0A835EKH9_9POAL|nr:hypothetical protein HU200_038366 [Digitaria exilis]
MNTPRAVDVGWGAIVRDADGEVAVAGRGRIDHVMDSFQAELISCLQGAQAAADIGASRVVLETDAMMVKNAVNSNNYNLAAGGSLIAELKYVLSTNFVEWDFEHVPRECNKVAHALAAWGHKCSEVEDPIVESLPNCIRVMVADDCSAIE